MSDSWHQNTIAITGVVGSGKSTAAKILSKLGGFVVGADEIAHEVLAADAQVRKDIVSEFGPAILNPSGAIDRKALGKVVFSDSEKRKRLEAITHPAIRKLAAKKFADALAAGHKVLVYDCPLLFEAGLHTAGFRKIVLISADEETILRRLQQNRGWSKEEALRRLRSQIPLVEKAATSDIVIDNSGTEADLESKLRALWPELSA